MASASFTEPPSQIAQPYGSVEPASMIGKLAPRPNTSPVPASCATQKPIQVCTSSDSKRLRARWFGVVRKCRASSIPPGIDSSPARSDDGGPGCENSAGIMPSSRTRAIRERKLAHRPRISLREPLDALDRPVEAA